MAPIRSRRAYASCSSARERRAASRALAHRRTREREVHAPRRGLARQRRPDIELGEDQRLWADRVEHRARVAGGVEGEIVGAIHRQRMRELLGARREEGVRELELRPEPAHRLEHGAGLQALAHRWSVHPDEIARRVAVVTGPLGPAGRDVAPRGEAAARLAAARRDEPCADPRRTRRPFVEQRDERMHARRATAASGRAARRRSPRRSPGGSWRPAARPRSSRRR